MCSVPTVTLVLIIFVLFLIVMLFYVLFVLCRSVYCLCVNVYCTVLLPPGVNPLAVNKYIVSL